MFCKLASDINLHICWWILYFNFDVKTGHECISKMFLSKSTDVTICVSNDLENLSWPELDCSAKNGRKRSEAYKWSMWPKEGNFVLKISLSLKTFLCNPVPVYLNQKQRTKYQRILPIVSRTSRSLVYILAILHNFVLWISFCENCMFAVNSLSFFQVVTTMAGITSMVKL
jgi:hypothetical protein